MTKHQIRTLSRSLFGLAVAGSLVVGCADAQGETDEPYDLEVSEQALERVYDGETLMLGIFFGRGPVAEVLPEVWGKKPFTKDDAARAFRDNIDKLERRGEAPRYDEKVLALIAQNEDRSARIVDDVAKGAIKQLVTQDREFARHFESGIYSGDPVIVSGVIEEAGRRFAEIVEIDAIRAPGRYGAEWFINENAAINVNAVLNVNVAVNVDTAYNVTQFWSRTFLDRESMLRNEMIVARITQRFAGARFGR